MVLSIGFLLLVSLVISAVITSLTLFMGNFLGGAEILAHVLDLSVSYPRDGALRNDLPVFLLRTCAFGGATYGSAPL